MNASDYGIAGRLYRQRRFDGGLTDPVPLRPEQEIHELIGDGRFLERTRSGLAVRYLVPAADTAPGEGPGAARGAF